MTCYYCPEPHRRTESKPTPDMPRGVYDVVDAAGIYWGTYQVSRNWCGDVFVMDWLHC